MANAKLIFREKIKREDGSIIEMVIWRLPAADKGYPHGIKYRLFYGQTGERIVGYDNERGKGDHRHYRDTEEPYEFASVEKLISDFLVDIERY